MTFKELKEVISRLEEVFGNLDNCPVFDSDLKPVSSVFHENTTINSCRIPVIMINSK